MEISTSRFRDQYNPKEKKHQNSFTSTTSDIRGKNILYLVLWLQLLMRATVSLYIFIDLCPTYLKS